MRYAGGHVCHLPVYVELKLANGTALRMEVRLRTSLLGLRRHAMLFLHELELAELQAQGVVRMADWLGAESGSDVALKAQQSETAQQSSSSHTGRGTSRGPELRLSY